MNINLIIYLISLIIMGSNGIVASFISLNSHGIVLMRTVIGSVCMILICILHREKFLFLKDKKETTLLFLSGLALGGGWLFLFEGYKQVGVSITTILYYLGPMIAMIISLIVFKEKLTKIKVIGAIIVFIGVVLLNGKLVGDTTKYFGLFCGLMSGILYALMLLFNKKVKTATGIENTTCQLVSSFILVIIYMLFNSGVNVDIKGAELIPILWIGIVNTCISCLLYYSSITKLPMSTVAICSYLDPVFAVIFSVIILHEKLSIIQIIGIILVVSGATISQINKIKK